MPVLFLGHGSPMNAIETNVYTQTLSQLGKSLPKPRAILCVSAHWETDGTRVTRMARPRTIHDFHGFPKALFDVQYPAAGSVDLADTISSLVKSTRVQADEKEWGLDHGAWSVLKHLYPQAEIPVVQLSLDRRQPASFHFQLERELTALREQGVLILGSGNVVHNLRKINWDEAARPWDWAVEFNDWMKDRLLARDYESIIDAATKTSAGKLSHPTLDHYWPLLYVLGASEDSDQLRFEYEGYQHASISMLSFSMS